MLDTNGDPVADGQYTIQFRLYDAAVAGNTLWDSGPQTVTVTNGLFSYDLGGAVAIPDDLFANHPEVWLGITVGSDPEISPRVKVTSKGFAYHALRSDSADWYGLTNIPAGFADNKDNGIDSGLAEILFVNRYGDYMYDDLSWWDLTDTAAIMDVSLRRFSTFGFDGQEQIRLWGGSWGEILLHDGQPANNVTAKLSATSSSGGRLELYQPDGDLAAELAAPGGTYGGGLLRLYDNLGFPFIVLDAGAPSLDDRVILPSQSVYSHELGDEPGIASRLEAGFNLVTTTPSDIATITISAPAAGYVWVMASGLMQLTVNGTPDAGNVIRTSLSRTSGTHTNEYDTYISATSSPSGIYRDHFALQMVTAVPYAQDKSFYLVASHDG
ncbi:MAG: hypothetical protein D6800_08520, partial [Candidatus Zixiibacteriota bacterium]